MDTNSGELVALRRVTVTVGNEFITIITDQLRDNRHYNITIRASNSAGEVTSSVEISKHNSFMSVLLVSCDTDFYT